MFIVTDIRPNQLISMKMANEVVAAVAYAVVVEDVDVVVHLMKAVAFVVVLPEQGRHSIHLKQPPVRTDRMKL